ncbi:unnamed protein product [Adineta steineri]|uniref:Uncharacterized protein n=1 Tax=Adineta steineri TaxID=433720 RepID=A0A815SV57_9BILA|nr:unnamed protein product [Adineta steineri]CAF1643820.1 unnamed protein product [Adineta steineri]
MVQRCQDVIIGNIEQYKLLMYLAPEDKVLEVKLIPSNLLPLPGDRSKSLAKKEKRIIKLTPRLAEVKACVLLFKSLIFTSSILYSNQIIKKSASILSLAIAELVESKLLKIVKKGFFSSKWTSVYIKCLLTTCDTDVEMDFEMKLSEIRVDGLNLENVRDSCHDLIIDGKGIISHELIHSLQQQEYNELNLNSDALMERCKQFQSNENDIPSSCVSSKNFESVTIDTCDVTDNQTEIVNMNGNVPTFTCGSSESAMVDNSNQMSEDDENSKTTVMELTKDAQEMNENEQNTTSKNKNYMSFKPNCTPISHRLRRRKSCRKKQH